MSTATTTRPSPQTPWSSYSSPRIIPNSSTTPAGIPGRMPTPARQSAPGQSAKALSPHSSRAFRASSPNYFEYVTDHGSNPPNSNAGFHARKNWSPPSTGDRPNVANSSQNPPLESQKRFENFRRQSDNNTFSLSHGHLRHISTSSRTTISPPMDCVPDKNDIRQGQSSPKTRHSTSATGTGAGFLNQMDLDPPSSQPPSEFSKLSQPSFFDIPRIQSPANDSTTDLSKLQRNQISHIDERHPRNSLPSNRADIPAHIVQRSETLPSSTRTDGPTMIAPHDLVELLKNNLPQDILLLDLRVFPQFSNSRITGALNLCIPTTLLKRPSFNVQKLAEIFTKESDKARFAQWKDAKAIVVYDASSMQLKDAASSVNTLKKFSHEDWHSATFIIRGGFNNFSKKYPDQIDKRTTNEMDRSMARSLSIEPPAAAPVAGGCMMPSTQNAANPFFNNIRQNMELIDGVGQMPVKLPSALKESSAADLPMWLRQITDENDKGKLVADRFLVIEKAEQQRMGKALSGHVSYGSPTALSSDNIQIAGIEKGAKNRYKDILPFDHSRVRLQSVPSGGCDYINASHIKTEWTCRHYIASQAPVPATFQDFWSVVWEQNARVIVMLTAEAEGGQRKSHPYWLPGDYGPFKLKALSEKRLSLEQSKDKPNRSFMSSLKLGTKDERPELGRRSSTNYSSGQSSTSLSPTTGPDVPHVVVRKLTLSHVSQPFEPLREITQLQYSNWPDFGAPAHPAHVLSLVELCNSIVRSYEPGKSGYGPKDPAREGDGPILVHCSAGCGRTGTFCTVDSTIDMLKRQRLYRNPKMQAEGMHDAMDVDKPGEETWLTRDDEDLVNKVVSDFRLQRTSMVQNLKQFVLCYESVMEWLVREMPEGKRLGVGSIEERKSWCG